jgi:hypothetical protein
VSEVIGVSLISSRLSKAYDAANFAASRPNTYHRFAVQDAQRNETNLSIILPLILVGKSEVIEYLTGCRQIDSTLPQGPFALRWVEFDFQIIIVYTINRKSQASEPLHPTAIIG